MTTKHTLLTVVLLVAGCGPLEASLTVSSTDAAEGELLRPPNINTPSAGETLSGAATLVASAGSRANRLFFELDGALIGEATYDGSGWKLPVDTARFANGAHALRAIAESARGNQSPGELVSFFIKNVAAVADAGVKPPVVDSGTVAPVVDAGVKPPVVDAGAPTSSFDAGSVTPVVDAGTVIDAGAPLTSGTCAGLSAPPQSGTGKVMYVSPSGSDTALGTATSPFKTIPRAVDAVNAGDTVVVEDGVYPPFDIQRGGTASNWVWVKARNRWGARVVSSASTGIHITSNVGYLRLDGFDVSGMRRDSDTGSAEALYVEGHDIEVVHGRFHDVHGCTSTTNGLVGAYNDGPNNVYDSNVFTDIYRWKNEQGCTKQDSWAHDHGVYVSSAGGISSGTRIRNNVFSNIKHGFGVQLYPGTMSDVSVLNNTFVGGNADHEGQIIIGATFSNTEIRNNIFYQPNGAGIQGYKFGGTMTVSNNLTTGAAITSRSMSGLTLSNNLVGKDPAFVSVSTGDFHLSSASPARDVGLAMAQVPVDFDGCSRPRGAGVDLGAFEY